MRTRRLLSTWLLPMLLLPIILLWTPSAHALENSPKLLAEVEVQGISDIRALHQMGLDIAARVSPSAIQVVVSEQELDQLRQAGWQVKVVNDDLVARFRDQVNVDGDLGAYHTYSEMLSAMQQIASSYPNLAKLVDIGDGWEKTQGLADRDIWALKISDTPDVEESEEPDILIMGCHHARELITVEIPLALAAVLTSAYQSSPFIQNLVDQSEIWIVPMVNPDGHAYVETDDPMWRKNRNTNGDSPIYMQGVDLNRNYGYQWGYDNYGSSPYPQAEDYRGTAAFSEPETQAIRDLAESHDFVISLSYHSYGDLFLFPWGYISQDTPDHSLFNLLGYIYTLQNHYTFGNVNDGIIYETNGDSDDWMYGEQQTKNKTLGITVEVGHQFQPPSSQIPQLVGENLAPALLMIYLGQLIAP